MPWDPGLMKHGLWPSAEEAQAAMQPPETISLLLPSRGRPDQFLRMVQSAISHAERPELLEVVFAVDLDDEATQTYLWLADSIRRNGGMIVKMLATERQVLSQYWNDCARNARGDILMHCGDDIVFVTPSWDERVREAFQQYPDRVVFVHGNDLGPRGSFFGTHGFIHRTWMEAVGYFVPPHYVSDYNDTHLNDVANMLGRRHYVDIITEHMHPAFGKGPVDKTHEERLARHSESNVDELYASLHDERVRDAQVLQRRMR